MDKRLKLTEAQWRLLHRFNDLITEMGKEKMLLVHCNGDIRVINGEYVEDYVFPEEIDEEMNEVEVRFEDFPLTHLNLFYSGGWCDDTFGIRFKE